MRSTSGCQTSSKWGKRVRLDKGRRFIFHHPCPPSWAKSTARRQRRPTHSTIKVAWLRKHGPRMDVVPSAPQMGHKSAPGKPAGPCELDPTYQLYQQKNNSNLFCGLRKISRLNIKNAVTTHSREIVPLCTGDSIATIWIVTTTILVW